MTPADEHSRLLGQIEGKVSSIASAQVSEAKINRAEHKEIRAELKTHNDNVLGCISDVDSQKGIGRERNSLLWSAFFVAIAAGSAAIGTLTALHFGLGK
jgi:hypothetical protein